MAFNVMQISPSDLSLRKGIGVNIPFNEGGVFTLNYTSKQAIRNNLINYFLTNPGERIGNPRFGGGLRRFIFEQISNDNMDYLEKDIQFKISTQFPNIIINNTNISNTPENNLVTININYSILNTNINDNLTLNFN